MRISSIAVEVKETVSLPGYCNTSHCVRYEAALDPSDNAEKMYRELLALAKFKVYHEIDKALEREDEPPKFHMGNRFDVLSSHRLKRVAVVPSGYDAHPSVWHHVKSGFTEAKAKAFAEKHASVYGHLVMEWSEEAGLPGLAESEMAGRNRDVGPEPDYCEECHDPISEMDPSHTLCDDCYQSEDEATPEAAPVPIEAEPATGVVCPKCDPNPAPGKIQLLCSEHEETPF